MAGGTMHLHYSALEKISRFDEIIYYSIIQCYVMTDPLCHDLSTIDKLMLALLPNQKLDIFHVFARVNWILSEIGIYFPDY